MSDLRVLIVADDPLARAGLTALLTSQAQLIIAGQTSSDADLRAATAAFVPDVVLWDLGWNPSERIDRVGRYTDESVAPVVALLPTAESAGAARAAGVRGVLGRALDGAQMAAAARAVWEGLQVFSDGMVAQPVAPDDVEPIVEPLSPRELDVLRGIAEGLSNKLIARQLEISEHTVKFHVNAILGKLGAQSRTEAVVRATRAGLIWL
ncbi:MAG: response regulator transcription factor [Anaerolineales bacterium]|nr:response regulator transcription factor [Anaerolineales bacterium]